MDDDFRRCKLLKSVFGMKAKYVHFVDVGKSQEIEDEDAVFYELDSKFCEDDFKFSFMSVCRLADKNQCLNLNIPSFDNFRVNEEVEVFVLSSEEPYYSVVSSRKFFFFIILS